MPKQITEQSLRNQIDLLERKIAVMIQDKSYWAIRGKINKLNKQLERMVTQKWLSQ